MLGNYVVDVGDGFILRLI